MWKSTKQPVCLVGYIQGLNQKIFISLYKMFVRTHLYGPPYEVKDIEMLENMRRRSTRQLAYLKDLPYEDKLRMLKLPTLSNHQWKGDLIKVHKIDSMIKRLHRLLARRSSKYTKYQHIQKYTGDAFILGWGSSLSLVAFFYCEVNAPGLMGSRNRTLRLHCGWLYTSLLHLTYTMYNTVYNTYI